MKRIKIIVVGLVVLAIAAAAFGVSALIFAYGLMQFVVSGPLGEIIERYGFQPVCLGVAFLPLISYLLVHFLIKNNQEVPV